METEISVYMVMVLIFSFMNATTGTSGIGNISNPTTTIKLPGVLPGYERYSVVSDVVSTLNVLINSSPASLQILYDQPYMDTVLELTHRYSIYENGILIYEYNGTISELNVLMNGATNNTIAVVLGKFTNYIEIFEKVRDHRINSYKVTWMLLLEEGTTENKDEVISVLEELLPEGTQVVLLVFSFPEVTTVYSATVDHKGDIRFQPSGTIRQDSRLKIHKPDDPEIYRDLRGRQLTVASVNSWPFMGLGKQYEDGFYEVVGGFEYEVLKALATTLNFTYQVRTALITGIGSVLPNGTSTGAIGMIEHREANFGIGILSISENREIAVNFAYPHLQHGFFLLSRAPTIKERTFAVFSPFSYQVWLIIIASLLITGSVLAIISEVSEKLLNEEKPVKSSYMYTFNIFRDIVLQGNSIKADKVRYKILFLFWYMFCLLIIAMYSGNLTALLAIKSYEKSINSLNDLQEAMITSGYILSLTKDTLADFFFSTAKSGIFKDIWDLMQKQDPKKSFHAASTKAVSEVLPKIIHEKYVIVMTRAYVGPILRRFGSRNFHQSLDEFYPSGVGVACPIGSPLREAFNKKIQGMVEGGLVTKWQQVEASKSPDKAVENDNQSHSPISLVQLQAAFYMLVFGWLIATNIFVMETVSRNCCFKKKKHSDADQ